VPIGAQTIWGGGAVERPAAGGSGCQPLGAAALVDPADLQRFFGALFRYADAVSYVSLRTFHQHDRGKPPLSIKGVKVGDPRLIDEIKASAVRAANVAAATVFAPPVATFENPKRAARRDLANGLAIMVEIDAGDSGEKLRQLEFLLGPPTVVVLSGGVWTDPATGEAHPKRHVYWRLSEATDDQAGHDLLAVALSHAATLIDADRSAISPVHPLRWPGSVHRKDPAHPVACRIERIDEQAEVHLEAAAEVLIEAASPLGHAGSAVTAGTNRQASSNRRRGAI
jgi:hypothetical protein